MYTPPLERHYFNQVEKERPKPIVSIVCSCFVGVIASVGTSYFTGKPTSVNEGLSEAQLVGCSCALLWYVASQHLRHPFGNCIRNLNHRAIKKIGSFLS
jgi:hypothetical protein